MPTVDAVTMAIYRSSEFFMFLAACIQKREGERERGGKEKEATALNWNFCFIPNLHNLFLAKGIVKA